VSAAPAKTCETVATPASASASQYSHMFQSHIGSNLREIQQEEEIIFFDDVKAFSGVNNRVSNLNVEEHCAEADVTFTDLKIEQIKEETQPVESYQE
jgi:hypothetical protein